MSASFGRALDQGHLTLDGRTGHLDVHVPTLPVHPSTLATVSIHLDSRPHCRTSSYAQNQDEPNKAPSRGVRGYRVSLVPTLDRTDSKSQSLIDDRCIRSSDILEDYAKKMRDAENDTHEGKRKVESVWSVTPRHHTNCPSEQPAHA